MLLGRIATSRLRSRYRLQLIDYVVGSGKLPCLVLGVNEFSIHLHVEYTTTPFHKNSFNPDFILNRVRQTGGPRQVVSLCAVGNLDRHVHRLPLVVGTTAS